MHANMHSASFQLTQKCIFVFLAIKMSWAIWGAGGVIRAHFGCYELSDNLNGQSALEWITWWMADTWHNQLRAHRHYAVQNSAVCIICMNIVCSRLLFLYEYYVQDFLLSVLILSARLSAFCMNIMCKTLCFLYEYYLQDFLLSVLILCARLPAFCMNIMCMTLCSAFYINIILLLCVRFSAVCMDVVSKAFCCLHEYCLQGA